jgi:photosystem II stability/assembly factor-like uncharacterized protein
MKKITHTIALIILTGTMSFNLMAQSGPPWVKTNVGYNYILRGIDFPSSQDDIGFIAGESLTYQGNGIVLKTTDGGATWNPVWTGAGEGLEGASFVDLDNGFIAGWPKLSAGWSGFGKTTDGGATWTSMPVVADVYYFTDVVFKDPVNGILLGSTNTLPGVWVTANGGATWTNGTGLASVPYHGCHVSGNTYFLVDNAGHIQKSVNNGTSWTTVYFQAGLLLTGIDFFNDLTGMACGDNGVIVKTYDGGATWALQTIGVDIWHDFGWQNQDHVFVCGTPEIVSESTNGGATWFNGFPSSAYQAALYECIFTPNGTGFICGSQGTLLKRLPSPVANFTAFPTGICTGGTVSYTSQSTGGNLTYNWWFEGGTPSVSTVPNPVVTYNTAGVYDVQLIVNNGNWSDTLLKPNYIAVSVPPATPVITANGFTLTSSSAAGNQWYRDGIQLLGATGQSYTAVQTGWYWDVVKQSGCSSDTSNHIYLVMTGNADRTGTGLTVSPVPNEGLFTVTISGPGGSACTLSAYDMAGTRVFRDDFMADGITTSRPVDLRAVPAGVYTLEFRNEHERIVKKVVICR